MRITQKLKQITFGLVLVLGLVATSVVSSPLVSADCDPNTQKCCGGVETSIIACEETGSSTGVRGSGIWGILELTLNILTAGVGIAAVGGIIYGAILYTSAGSSTEQIKKATTVFTNVAIGVIAYALMYAGLNFLIPGGLFG